jgi:hypothetical protein
VKDLRESHSTSSSTRGSNGGLKPLKMMMKESSRASRAGMVAVEKVDQRRTIALFACVIKTWSSTQKTIATSSGEAEY